MSSQQPPPPPERRRFPRVQLAAAVQLRFPSAEAAIDSRTVDISEGGVFIQMRDPRPEGTSIHLDLRIGDRALKIGGVVVRCVRPGKGEPTGIGVLFTTIAPDDVSFVKALVRDRTEAREPAAALDPSDPGRDGPAGDTVDDGG